MKIDDIDIRKYNSKQLQAEFFPPGTAVNTEWADGSALPYEYKTYIKSGKLSLSLLVRGDDRNEVTRNISGIMQHLTKTVVLTLDKRRGVYVGALKRARVEKTPVLTRRILELEFEGYIRDRERTLIELNNVGTAELMPGGTRETPCIIEITPSEDLDIFTISGFGEDDITVNSLKAGKTLIIDGERGTVTADGASVFENADIWAFPTLMSGKFTQLTFSSDKCEVRIGYYSMWL